MSSELHSLLRRQVQRVLGGADNIPPAMKPLLDAVSAAYHQADTDRQMTERSLELSSQELRQANEDLWRVFRFLPDRFFRVDHQAVILDASLCGQTNASPGSSTDRSCIGKHIDLVTGQITGMMLQRAVDEVISSGRRTVLKYAGEGPDSARFFEAIILPLAGSQAVIFIRDVTREAHLEVQLRQAQKMEAIGQLAGGIAHDFNNLLTVVVGNLDLAAGRTAQRASPEFENIRRAAERGIGLISQLLAFSRRQVLHPRVVNINDTVEQTVHLLRRIIGENIRIETSFGPGVRPVRVDPVQMEQVIMNLAVNARDAMPDGGVITFTTANSPPPGSADGGDTEILTGDYVALTITDTGCGMSPEILAHLFEPFFTTKEVGKGTGLGLATVYGVVKQSGGQITVTSEPRRGTTFRILLPRAHAGETAHGDRPAAGVSQDELHGTETILLVEDEEPIRKLCGKFLTRYGYRVLAAGSGEEALGLLARKPVFVHLLVTDVVMPGIHGGELARRVARQRPGTRVLFMSGHPDETVEKLGIDAEGTNYIAKPFRGEDLIHKIRTLLDAPIKQS